MIHTNKAKEKRKRYEISVNLNNPGSVLLTFLSNEFEIVSKNQSGFRKGFSTTDNIFIMHALVSIYFSSGKKRYCTFVDFRKAFDTVWRTGLWKKLLRHDINGKCFKIIYNMYDNIKSCVLDNDKQSNFFLV